MILPALAVAAAAAASPLAPCEFHHAGAQWAGSCGQVFDETPSFTIAPAKAITTGAWRKDDPPRSVWAGVLSNKGDPDFPIEIEVHAGGTGVLRSEYGWHAISGFSADDTVVRFQMDAAHELAPNALDQAILERADAILSSPAVWNRTDNRKCPPTATTWSVYCATIRATAEVTGASHHRRPAMELVRQIIDERTANRNYDHRLMDYNNDATTTLADVHSLFAEALKRVPASAGD